MRTLFSAVTTSLVLALVSLFVIVGPANAAPSENAEISMSDTSVVDGPMVRRQFLYRAARHEITPMLSFTLNDALSHSYMAGARYNYHFNNWLGFGITGSGNICSFTDSSLCMTKLADTILEAGKLEKLRLVSQIEWMVSPHVTVVPVTGKVAFSWLGQWAKVANHDLHIVAGGSLVSLGNAGAGGRFPAEVKEKFDKTAFGPMVGLGYRVFFNDQMGLNVDVRDVMIKRSLNGSIGTNNKEDGAAEEALDHNFIVSVGLNLYFPRVLKQSL